MHNPYKRLLPGVYEINLLDAQDSELEQISKEKSLGLSLGEMKKIRDYFKKEQRNPTDVELEAFAQSWSEHCCYKTSKPILKRTVFNIESPQNICVISEDAGVVDFDDNYAYVVALESHNHPSALDPYGGAATGVGGIIRDVVCMGAQPIALIDPLFFGPLELPEKDVPQGTKHPRYLFNGVVSGIADYGNRVGIPTVCGMVEFDESYTANCLVNVGCIGILKKDEIIHSRVGDAGDLYILAGGKTGRDGIHGVTFASAELNSKSESESTPAVQLGYAIMKEPLIHACLEANKKGLLSGMKDFGGGGLSCVAGEMAHAGDLGCTIELDKVQLKEDGMSPWEIWVSESQERMMVSVKPENAEEVLDIFRFWDVPAEIVGKVEKTNRIHVTYQKQKVLDLELEFLLQGVTYERPFKRKERDTKDPEYTPPELSQFMQRIFSSPRIASKERIIRGYDHQVRGNTILSSMQGKINTQTHGDAAVLKPVDESTKGLALCSDVNPQLCKSDPYWGSASAVDEVYRNLVSVNAKPHSMADCLNFANPEKEECLGEFVEACEGLYFAANSYQISFVSGNVSLYNEAPEGPIAPTPTLLGVGIVKDIGKCVTSDLKGAGNHIYLVGDTLKELGGSEYYRILGLSGGMVPRVYPEKTKKSSIQILEAMDLRIIQSCHDLSTGGLMACAAEMAFGGDVGIEFELDAMGDLALDIKLFSESNSRWLIEVRPEDAQRFEETVEATLIGKTTPERHIKLKNKGETQRFSLDELKAAWDAGIQQ